jgi:hypothetical protein
MKLGTAMRMREKPADQLRRWELWVAEILRVRPSVLCAQEVTHLLLLFAFSPVPSQEIGYLAKDSGQMFDTSKAHGALLREYHFVWARRTYSERHMKANPNQIPEDDGCAVLFRRALFQPPRLAHDATAAETVLTSEMIIAQAGISPAQLTGAANNRPSLAAVSGSVSAAQSGSAAASGTVRDVKHGEASIIMHPKPTPYDPRAPDTGAPLDMKKLEEEFRHVRHTSDVEVYWVDEREWRLAVVNMHWDNRPEGMYLHVSYPHHPYAASEELNLLARHTRHRVRFLRHGLSRQGEQRIIAPLWKSESELDKGCLEKFYLISTIWWRSWCAYAGFDPEVEGGRAAGGPSLSVGKPDIIDNRQFDALVFVRPALPCRSALTCRSACSIFTTGGAGTEAGSRGLREGCGRGLGSAIGLVRRGSRHPARPWPRTPQSACRGARVFAV